MLPRQFFLTGTSTNVGKTYVAGLILRHWGAAGHRRAAFKPICCGDRADASALLEACGENNGQTLNDVNPLWYRFAAAPYAAALVENRPADLTQIRDQFARLQQSYDYLLVEGVGGWEVPISHDFTAADLAQEFNLPIVVVVDNCLGALNHTLLTAKNLRQRGLTCAGLVLNSIAEERDAASITNRGILEDILGLPILAELLHGETEWPGN